VPREGTVVLCKHSQRMLTWSILKVVYGGRGVYTLEVWLCIYSEQHLHLAVLP
jgi:hypothetical protein